MRARKVVLKTAVYLSLIFILTSCASYFKRKECEKTDWHAYGKSVAMSGKRLTGDHFVGSCEKVEAKIDYAALDVGFKAGMANYCLPETVYATGRSGQKFNPQMCDGSNLKELHQEHKEGVAAYCQPENAYRVGAQGEKYGNICPHEMEKAFFAEYEKGRKIYLAGQISQKEDEMKALDRQMKDKRNFINDYRRQLAALPVIQPPKRKPSDKKQMEYTPEEQRILDERSRLSGKISQLERQIKNDQGAQSRLRQEIGQLKTELTALQR